MKTEPSWLVVGELLAKLADSGLSVAQREDFEQLKGQCLALAESHAERLHRAHEMNHSLFEQNKKLVAEVESKKLIHIGYTNGDQVFHAQTDDGLFYPDTDNNCYIPVYMLKIHAHRIETTSVGGVTIDDIERLKL